MQNEDESTSSGPGAAVRGLIRAADRAALGTIMRPPKDGAEDGTVDGTVDGHPYTSLVLAACAPDATPLLLLSDLAEHARNIAADPRVSLLYDGTGGLDDPLTGARASVLGRAERIDERDLRARYLARYLARHPAAADYAGFADFALYRVALARAHLVAGFGDIHWLDATAVLYGEETGALAAAEADILAHMNADHGDAIGLYATALLGLAAADWAMTGIDPEGLDLRAGGRTGRLAFDRPVLDAAAARAELVRLAGDARAA